MAIDLTTFNETVEAIKNNTEKANVKGNKSAAKRVRALTLALRKAIIEIREQALALYKTEAAPAVEPAPKATTKKAKK